jgi:hypothetical protein
MKYLKTYQQIQEANLKNIAAGLGLAASTLTSCEKPENMEYTVKFGSKTGKIVTDNTPGSQKDFIGDKDYIVTKELEPKNWESSPQWIFANAPTAEQWCIMFSYKNYLSEIRINKDDLKSGDNVVFYDLKDIKISAQQTQNATLEVTESEFYKTAYQWCEDNIDKFQKDLDNLEESGIKPEFGELLDYSSERILNNPENKPQDPRKIFNRKKD